MTFRGIGNCQITRSELFRHTSKIGQNWRKLAQKRLSPETVRVDPRTEVTCHPYELRDGLGVPRKYLSRIVSSSSLCGAPNPRFKKWLKLAQKRLSPETVRVDPRTEVTCHPYELRDGLGVPRKYLSRILSSSSLCGAPNPRFKKWLKLAQKRLSPETVQVDPRTEVTCHPYELRDGLGVPRKYLSRILSSISLCGAPNPRFKKWPKKAQKRLSPGPYVHSGHPAIRKVS